MNDINVKISRTKVFPWVYIARGVRRRNMPLSGRVTEDTLGTGRFPGMTSRRNSRRTRATATLISFMAKFCPIQFLKKYIVAFADYILIITKGAVVAQW